MAKYHYSPLKQKIVLLLATGVTLGLSKSPKVHWRIVNNLPKALKEINRRVLRNIIKEFKYERLVDFRTEKDGMISVVLSEKGKRQSMLYDPDNLTIKQPARWDRKWRLIMFDIPEKKKPAREALRKKMSEMGLKQLQRSVWLSPYECKKEVDFIVEFFEVRNYVNYAVAESIANDAELKLHFDLS